MSSPGLRYWPALRGHLEAWMLRGVDLGPPPGMAQETWSEHMDHLTGQMRSSIEKALDEVEGGSLLTPEQSREQLRRRRRD